MNGKKILVVDDNPVVNKAVSMKLTNAGYEVFNALDGSEAVSMARQKRPDLILLDISFPPDVAHGGGVAWDGFLIMQWLKRLEEAKNIPVIMISGGDQAKYEKKALEAGAVRYFQKPVNNEELLKVLRETLEKGAAPVSQVPPRPQA
jgi:two-component system, OmpR family, KDP operon response regulator KdpE